MSIPVRLAAGLLVCLLPAAALAQGDGIAWEQDLPSALAKAKETGKILLICVNAKHVEGREDEEPAAKGLREVVYRDPRVVAKSRDLVCLFLTPESGSAAYAELSRLGIGGKIVSPQHIFVAPEGDRILLRREYWRHGKGDRAVEKLLELIAAAEAAASGKAPEDPEAPEEAPAGAPEDGAARETWILQQVAIVADDADGRDGALMALVRADRDGDCTGPLIELLDEKEKNEKLLVALIRALGVNGLEAAAEPIAEFLDHREADVRANAAVSLEYIGCDERKVLKALSKAAGREKDEIVANHMYRALGRCGVEDSRTRGRLLKSAGSGRSEFATYGPTIALAYFEEDERAARGVEELLKRIGVPGGRRGGGQNTVKRGLLSWTLACIGDEKSERFVRDELMAKLKNVKAFWVDPLLAFWDSVAEACGGDESAMERVEGGVRAFVGFAKRFDMGRYGAETRNLMDDARKGREHGRFTPKGDNLLGGGDD